MIKTIATLIKIDAYLDVIGRNTEEIKENIKLSKEELNLSNTITWVNVSDRLPEDKVLVLCARTETSMSGVKRISPTTGRVNNGRFSCEWDWISVDYWAELIESPCV